MKRLNFNQINSVMGKNLTPAQRMMGSKVKLYKPKTVRSTIQVDNNDPCPCGSGMKFKKCCKS